MIDPKYQWAIQIDVTNECVKACSNCTRFVGHAPAWRMTLEQFEQAVLALVNFPIDSPPSSAEVQQIAGNTKLIGVIGGEPLLHPDINEMFNIIEEVIPNKIHRGLWTGLQWQKTKYFKRINEVFGYVNNNLHTTPCVHSPILVSVSSQVPNKVEQDKFISNCWLQRLWSSTITPKGFFFCEVAGNFDMLFNGPGGLPVEPGVWRRPLRDFQDQINLHCYGCGVPLQLPGRSDREEVDDVSLDNLEKLKRIGSTRAIVLNEAQGRSTTPWRYLV